MFPEFMENLVPTLRKFIEEGTPKQSKQAVRCLHRNLLPEKHDLFKDIFEVICCEMTFLMVFLPTAGWPTITPDIFLFCRI